MLRRDFLQSAASCIIGTTILPQFEYLPLKPYYNGSDYVAAHDEDHASKLLVKIYFGNHPYSQEDYESYIIQEGWMELDKDDTILWDDDFGPVQRRIGDLYEEAGMFGSDYC